MKLYNYLYVFLLLGLLSCSIDEIPNPNGPSIEGVLADAKKSDLQVLVTGAEHGARSEVGFYYDVASIIGREYYYFTGSDPRYTGEILGKGESQLDNAGFYGTRPYFGRYKNIKNLNVLMQAAQNSSAISPAELKGYEGFAKTMQAYEYHLVDNLQYENGIRVDVADPDNLGPFVSHTEALTFILNLLDEAYNDLQSAEFSFNLSSGLGAFANPSDFAKFNRALSARIALYLGQTADISSRLSASFMDPAGNPAEPSRYYSSAGGDQVNNLFRPPNQADAIIAHPSFIADAEAGDNRLAKVLQRDDTLTLDGLSGNYDVWVFRSFEDHVPYITNEELILIDAEASVANGDIAGAVNAINNIRSRAGLGDYSGEQTNDALMAEIRKQRRYSLFGLAHRWVDMRRWGLLDELPLDRPGDDVWVQMPRPVSEN